MCSINVPYSIEPLEVPVINLEQNRHSATTSYIAINRYKIFLLAVIIYVHLNELRIQWLITIVTKSIKLPVKQLTPTIVIYI